MRREQYIMLDGIGGLLTVRGAAQRLGVSYVALDTRLRRNPNVVIYRLGNERLVSLADLQRAGVV